MSKTKILFPVLILAVWLFSYIVCTINLEPKIEWDEAKYLSCAKGIAENLDFSSRAVTVQGLIKYGFPQNTLHYPLHSSYMAIFFKLFGASVKTAYFSNWFACLITCFFIYLTMLLVTDNNRTISFFSAISFLYLPKVITHCNSAMMEIPGCALISFFSFLIFRSISQKKINPFLFGLSAICLYFYKSLFIGVVCSLILLFIFVSKAENKTQFYLSFIKLTGLISAVCFIFMKFVFLPLAPWMVFLPKQIGIDGLYADFAGGFFNDILGNLRDNFYLIFEKIVFHYYPFLVYFFLPKGEPFYPIIPYWFEFGIYFLAFFYVIVLSIFMWKIFSPVQRYFILFVSVSIIIFNVIFVFIIGCEGIGLLYRYNLVYIPLLIISAGIIFYSIFNSFNSLFLKYKTRTCFLLLSFVFLIYVPIFYCSKLIINKDETWAYDSAHKNTEIIKKYIQNSNSMFIYFTGGSHVTWELFPVREVFMEATNEKIKKINSVLPKPIEYLFLSPENILFKENQDLISKGQPIIDSSYTLSGVDSVNKIVVYKYSL